MVQKCLSFLALFALTLGTGMAQEKVKLPKGPPPHFFTIAEISKDNLELQEVSVSKKDGWTISLTYKPAIKDIDIYDAGGKKLSTDDFQKRAKVGTVVLVAFDVDKVDPAYLSILKADTLVIVDVTERVPSTPLKNEK